MNTQIVKMYEGCPPTESIYNQNHFFNLLSASKQGQGNREYYSTHTNLKLPCLRIHFCLASHSCQGN